MLPRVVEVQGEEGTDRVIELYLVEFVFCVGLWYCFEQGHSAGLMEVDCRDQQNSHKARTPGGP